MRNIVFVITIFLAVLNIQANDEFMDDFNNEFNKQKVEVYDPLSGYNRAMTSFNDGLYTYFLSPVAKGYATVVPEPARVGVSNVFDNLMFPVRFINNLLQFKIANSFEELGRFAVNSTFGIFGLMDVAGEHLNWQKHDEDFGQTLGFYGVGSGPHIVLPFFGPSNLRDTVGFVADGYPSPLSISGDQDYKIPNNSQESVLIGTYKVVNKTSLNLGQYESLKKDAIDFYPFVRDAYEQKRAKEIKD